MAEEEEKREDHKKEEHKSEAGKGGIAGSFAKHKTLWIVGGVGAAGVLLLLFMNSGGSSTAAQPSTTDTSTTGQGGAVDTSSLVGTGGAPSWYNPGTAENMDYWPYVPNSTGSSSSSGSGSSKGSGSKSGSGSSKSGGSKSGSGSSKGSGSKSGSGSSKSGSKSSGNSSNHGVKHGVTPSTKGTHGYVYTTKAGDTLSSLQKKFFPTSNGTNAQGNIMNYGNNNKIFKQNVVNPKTGQIKPGTKIVA